MKRAHDGTEWLYNNTGEVVGFSLGHGLYTDTDCAGMKRALGISKPNMHDVNLNIYLDNDIEYYKNLISGIDAIKITSATNVQYMHYTLNNKKTKQKIQAAYVIFSPTSYVQQKNLPCDNAADFQTDLEYEHGRLVASWDMNSFIIHVAGVDNVERLKDFYKHFIANDIVFAGAYSGWHTSNTGGFSFGYLSKLPSAFEKTVLTDHNNKKLLYELVANTKIIETLRASNKGWYVLDPCIKNGTLQFFLNPSKQHEYNYGWFTVEELRDWANNTGPIVKSFNVQHTNSMEP